MCGTYWNGMENGNQTEYGGSILEENCGNSTVM
jgi:hypothetical protein